MEGKVRGKWGIQTSYQENKRRYEASFSPNGRWRDETWIRDYEQWIHEKGQRDNGVGRHEPGIREIGEGRGVKDTI